ncbi:hypothetical protein [Dactylosporangium sp. CA-233914]|uniref:hypothetical protein n=1 Tax=Dactylosporangium sp. CA-233914 TaxID=3239934 RepID=UPI003D8BC63B
MRDIGRALVVGATGNIGRVAAGLLRERGVAVRGLARDASGLPDGVSADVRDLAAPRRAAEGVDALLPSMTEPGHAGRVYVLSGPSAITQAEQVRVLGATAQEIGREEARAGMLAWADPAFADSALDYWASLVDSPEPVTGTVRELTGRPVRTFAQWARDHAGDFRTEAL